MYQLGGHDEVIKFVIKNGKVVYSRPQQNGKNGS